MATLYWICSKCNALKELVHIEAQCANTSSGSHVWVRRADEPVVPEAVTATGGYYAYEPAERVIDVQMSAATPEMVLARAALDRAPAPNGAGTPIPPPADFGESTSEHLARGELVDPAAESLALGELHRGCLRAATVVELLRDDISKLTMMTGSQYRRGLLRLLADVVHDTGRELERYAAIVRGL
jgi:hypothetical protein